MAEKPHIFVAPMMDWTDRHCRYFHRLIAPSIVLYTEMVTTGALIHGDAERHLRFNTEEHPVALQLGGSDPQALAACAKLGEEYGYDEVNLNCGCPSDRVQQGRFGACLMAEPQLVASCVKAMQDAVSIPVTVKCRIGIDDVDDEPFLMEFIETVSATGCNTFVIHARKAILEGLSPKENRSVPPLRYDIAERMRTAFPALTFIVNGGIGTVEEIQEKCDVFDGVMLGRRAYQDPYFLSDVERAIYGTAQLKSREEIVQAMIPYIQHQQNEFDTPVKSVTRHMLGLFQGVSGAKAWKRHISENAPQAEDAETLLLGALDAAHSRVKEIA